MLIDAGGKKFVDCSAEGVALYKAGNYVDALRSFQSSVRYAREESATTLELCELLNNLAVSQISQAKLLDAESTLKEAFTLLESPAYADLDEYRIMRALCLNTRCNLLSILCELDALEAQLKEGVEILVDEEKYIYASEMIWQLCFLYLEKGLMQDGEDAIARLKDVYAEVVDEDGEPFFRVYRDEANGSWPRMGFGWDEPGYFDSAEVEASVKVSLLQASFCQSLPNAKEHCQNALNLCAQLDCEPTFYLFRLLSIKSDLTRETQSRVQAAELANEAFVLAESFYGAHHPAIAGYLLKVVAARAFLESREDYEPMLFRAMDVLKDAFGERHFTTARANVMWSDFMALDGMRSEILQKREELISAALDILGDIFEEYHPDVVKAELSLADIYRATGRIDESEQLLQKALRLLDGRDDSAQLLLNVRRMLISFYARLGREEELDDCIATQSQLICSDAKMTPNQRLGRMLDFAFDLNMSCRFEAAETVLLKGIELSADDGEWQKHFSLKLAQLYADTDRESAARELLSSIQVESGNSAYALHERYKFASILATFDADESTRQIQEIFDCAIGNLPECAVPLGLAAAHLIDEYLRLDILEGAVNISKKLLENKGAMGLMGVTSIPVFLRCIASALANKRDKRADEMYSTALTSAEEVAGFQPEVLEYALADFAEYCVNQSQGERAEKMLRRLIALRSDLYGENNVEFAATILGLSAVLLDLKKNVEAEQLNQRSIAILEVLDGETEILQKALSMRVAILRKHNQHVEACELEKRILELARRREKEFDETVYPS